MTGPPPDGPRYQNRACKYYKLTSDNDGEAFRWTSNQIIGKGVPEEALQTASLLFSQCGRQEDGEVHHEKYGGDPGRVETLEYVQQSPAGLLLIVS